MHSGIHWEKRERALKILETATVPDENTHLPEPSQLRAIYYWGFQYPAPGAWLGGLFFLMMPLLSGVYLFWTGALAKPSFELNDLAPLGVIALVLGLGWYKASCMIERRNVRVILWHVGRAYDELRSMQSQLSIYLMDLDLRTRRYIHAVTSTKTMSYFLLVQINEALVMRLAELDDLLVRPNTANVLASLHLLKSELVLKSGVLTNENELQLLPLRRTSRAIELLIDELERGLAAIEGSIARARDFLVD
jgi:hypothetical protein